MLLLSCSLTLHKRGCLREDLKTWHSRQGAFDADCFYLIRKLISPKSWMTMPHFLYPLCWAFWVYFKPWKSIGRLLLIWMIASSGFLLFNAHYTLVYWKRTADGGSTWSKRAEELEARCYWSPQAPRELGCELSRVLHKLWAWKNNIGLIC